MIEMTAVEIDGFLGEQRIGRLCMAGQDGRPYSLPFPFCWMGGCLYLRVGTSGRKGEILRENDRVCFEVDHITDTLSEYASVLIEGRLVVVEDLAEKARVKRRNDEKYNRLRGGYRPGHGRSTPLDQLPLKKIVVERVTGRKKEPAAETVAPAAVEH
jgi:nitroimidazol reductase NimA-like FMN-containing flavoprotein (pyridoxamine 5'-phosphate oxidase superfamily)